MEVEITIGHMCLSYRYAKLYCFSMLYKHSSITSIMSCKQGAVFGLFPADKADTREIGVLWVLGSPDE